MEIRTLEKALDRHLLDDKVFIYPTDTCYGIGCMLSSKKAVERIYQIKGRDMAKPLSIMVSTKSMFRKFGKINDETERLINKYLPGALTIVVPRTEAVPDFFNPGVATIGIRIPQDDFCMRLVEAVGGPIITTSANLSGGNNLYRPAEILREFSSRDFSQRPDIFFNGGELSERPPSTVVSCVGRDGVKVLRQGDLRVQ